MKTNAPVSEVATARAHIYVSNQLVVAFEGEGNLLYANWIGVHGEATVRHGGLKILEAMKAVSSRHGCVRVLNDNRRVVGVWRDAVSWAAKEWFPAMVDAGLNQFAWILSSKATPRIAGMRMRILSDGSTGMMAAFTEEDPARRWLSGAHR